MISNPDSPTRLEELDALVVLCAERPSRPLLVVKLLVEELLGRNDACAHMAERLSTVRERSPRKGPALVTRHDDRAVDASDEEKARLLPALLEDELGLRVTGDEREAVVCEQQPDPLTMTKPRDEVGVGMLARDPAEVEIERRAAS
jgi:hypothetical protein